MNQTMPSHPAVNPQINERLWQAWMLKHRHLDKARAKRFYRVVQIVLGIVFVAAVIQHLMA
jgi:hypothetical protein